LSEVARVNKKLHGFSVKSKFPEIGRGIKKMAGYSHRTAQPLILAVFLPWGGSAGAGRVRPAGAKVRFALNSP